MIKETFLNFNMLYLPVIALMIFLIMFVSVLYWVNRGENKKLYKYMGNLPIESDEVDHEGK